MSTINDAMNYMADHASKKFRTATTTLAVGNITNGSTKWVNVPRPSGTYDYAWITGWYISGSGNTSTLVYQWNSGSGSMALKNLSTSTISPTINMYWTLFG